jgi:hypothetical protein
MTRLQAQQQINDVISGAFSIALEKMAAEVVRDVVRDPAFREELKRLARQRVSRDRDPLYRLPFIMTLPVRFHGPAPGAGGDMHAAPV